MFYLPLHKYNLLIKIIVITIIIVIRLNLLPVDLIHKYLLYYMEYYGNIILHRRVLESSLDTILPYSCTHLSVFYFTLYHKNLTTLLHLKNNYPLHSLLLYQFYQLEHIIKKELAMDDFLQITNQLIVWDMLSVHKNQHRLKIIFMNLFMM